MLRGRRSDFLLGGLVLVALANGLLLGLTFYGLLAAALKLVQGNPPPLGYALLAGAIAGLSLLALSLRQERALREGEYGSWAPGLSELSGHPLAQRFQNLVAASSLTRMPALLRLGSPDPNAFALGRSRDNASIIVTTGLLNLLEADEQDAVLAHELAHVESEDLRAVGLADAVADSIGDLARTKRRFLWGPKAIVTDLRPFLLVSLAGFIAVSVLPASGGENGALTLFLAVLGLGILYALWRAAWQSWQGLAQLFLFISFFGPLSLVEAVLAPPTAVMLSRLVSRARIHEADARALELTRNRTALRSALEKLERLERSPSSPWLGYLRFSLFVAPRPQTGYQAWLARLYATHPSISSRLEALRELG